MSENLYSLCYWKGEGAVRFTGTGVSMLIDVDRLLKVRLFPTGVS